MANGKSNGNGSSKKMPPKRVQRIRGITQDVGRVTKNAFGDSPTAKTIVSGLNAFSKVHVPLPRAVGGYVVVRTSQVLSVTEEMSFLGPMRSTSTSTSGGGWTNYCRAYNSVAPASTSVKFGTGFDKFEAIVNDNGVAGAGFSRANVVPAAFSVQIMNTEALQTTDGIAYIGRSNQITKLGGSPDTYADLSNEMISFTSPRLCSAGKLALRGVQVDAVPYDMNDLSDFDRLITPTAPTTYDQDDFTFSGFAPIFIANPNKIGLQVLVTCEWRVRFDSSNPAFAAHCYYTPSTLAYWDRLLRHCNTQGNGVRDIVEVVNDVSVL